MQILYCGVKSSSPDDSGDRAEEVVLRELRQAGHEVTVQVESESGLATRAGIASQFEVGRSDNALASTAGALAADVAVMVRAERYDVVIIRGIELNRILMEDEALAGRLWALLTEADLESQITSGDKAEPLLQTIVQKSRVTLVENGESLRSVKRAVPLAHHQVFHIAEAGSLSTESRAAWVSLPDLATLSSAQRRVLVYRDRPVDAGPKWARETYAMAHSLASPDVHIILMCHDAFSLFGTDFSARSPFVTLVEPPSATHQILNGQLLPRFAAWHVAVAAKGLDCAVVLSDDIEMVVFGFSNDYLRGRLWPLVRLASLNEFNERKNAFEQLTATVSQLVFVDHDSRALFESRISEATSKTVVLPKLGLVENDTISLRVNDAGSSSLLKQYLDRATANYSSVPKNDKLYRVLAVGHDFKFAGELLDILSHREDIELRADHWVSQTKQDESQSRDLIDWADVIFCEFASHNAVWYSWEKRPGQTLIVRFHGYELFSPWIQDINLAKVDMFVFVSEFYREKVIETLGWPREKTAVIPNVVDILDLSRPKGSNSRFHLGIAGIVPILKRPDRALDLLELLLESDERYTLHIRGRNPWEYGWMWQQDDVRESYEAFYERLALNPKLRRRVAFEEFGPDMGRWFQNIGWVLSPSYRETFHLAPVEGMASGAVPVVWEREGAYEIFGFEWVHQDTNSAAEYIIRANASETEYNKITEAAANHASQFDVAKNSDKWLELIFTNGNSYSDFPAPNILAERQEVVFSTNESAINLLRLMSVLHRDGDFARMEEVAAAHPDLAKDLPPHFLFDSRWRDGVKAMREAPPTFIERTYGTAYLARPDTLMFAADSRSGQGSAYPLPTAWIDDVESGQLRLVSVASAALDPHLDTTVYGRSSIAINGLPAIQLALRNSSRLSIAEFVMAAADALVREARVVRPAAIAAQGDFWVAFPALIAARRLGVPFLVAESQSDEPLSLLCRAEADGVLSADSSIRLLTQQATSKYYSAVDSSTQRQLAKLKVGVIADHFTSQTISTSFEAVALSRSQGYTQVASLALDAIFVESAWEGPDSEWRRGVAYYADGISDLEKIVNVARARNIPIVFWNKEDPVHFKAFERTAAMMDHVFTTDADMIGCYLQSSGSVAKTVSSLPFYAEPEIHNPLPSDRPYNHSISYAGTYYGDRFKERSIELHSLLNVAKRHGLTIYDRQVNIPNSPYHFPPELKSLVREGVPYEEVLHVYKAHPVNINVNSADDSPTMFSRRVVEIAASGSVVLSGKGRGITEQLQGIEAGGSDARWAELLEVWMSDENSRLCEAWRQMRTIARSHLASQAMTLLMRTAGVPVASPQLPSYGVVVSTLEKEDVDSILGQTWRPVVVFNDSVDSMGALSLRKRGISVHALGDESAPQIEWFGSWTNVPTDTYYEDILHATRFGAWDYLSGRHYEDGDGIGKPIVELQCNGVFSELRRWQTDLDSSPLNPLTWVMPRS